jgi:CHAT domain-containing protein
LIAVNPDAQFSLRDTVEPIYREYISLLLPIGKNPAQENIQKSLRLIDSLQLAELENFFRCNLLQARQVQVDQAEDPTAAVFHMIILDDRIETILKLPQQTELIRQTSLVKRSELEQQLGWFREQLKDRSSGADVQKTAQLVYDWLLRSTEPQLEVSNIKTLVFVLDGSLRGIPMAALYNGQHYLVEKYAVAITPGLQLLGAKQNYSRSKSVLIAGLTTGSTITVSDRPIRFSPLTNVLQEVQQIKALLPQSKVLLDDQFTTEKFRNQVSASSYAIVHVATHGRFSSNPDETFILTASAQPVDVNELQTILQNRSQAQAAPVELLVFSACETAVGDKRAALGLAGVAIRAGAFSTLASLWAVDDASTSLLMGQFYRAFSQGDSQISKAEALRRAQLSLLYGREVAPTADLQKSIGGDNAETDADFSHPYFWTPFVLVGDWL